MVTKQIIYFGLKTENYLDFVFRMAEHIDNNRVHNDLRYRFEYLSKFLNFTSDDIAMLNRFAPILSPHIPVVVDTAYRKLFSFDVTKNYFVINNDDFPPKYSCDLKLESTQMIFRKDVLSMYLKHVLTQSNWNDTFLQYLSHVGKIHAYKVNPSPVYVDYVHINALLGYLEHLLIGILWNTENLEGTIRQAIIAALNKFFWIQNNFFIMHYLPIWKETPLPNKPFTRKNKYCCI